VFCQFYRVPFRLRAGSLLAKVQAPLCGYLTAYGRTVSLPLLAIIFPCGFGGATGHRASLRSPCRLRRASAGPLPSRIERMCLSYATYYVNLLQKSVRANSLLLSSSNCLCASNMGGRSPTHVHGFSDFCTHPLRYCNAFKVYTRHVICRRIAGQHSRPFIQALFIERTGRKRQRGHCSKVDYVASGVYLR
jgi:hypothetical protein